MQRLPIVAGNWKMNGSRSLIESWCADFKQLSAGRDFSGIELAVFPPAPYIPQVIDLSSSSIVVGAQSIAPIESGAYTGGVSAAMCRDLGCQSVLLGHSERRLLCQETCDDVAKQAEQALAVNLQPILCVGETAPERAVGETLSVIKRQLAAVFDLDNNRTQLSRFVVAYEPVWAIGTGDRAEPDDIVSVHSFIRSYLRDVNPDVADSVRILYGGSVKPSNAADLFVLPDVDGALVGGASLTASDFLEIVELCCKSY